MSRSKGYAQTLACSDSKTEGRGSLVPRPGKVMTLLPMLNSHFCNQPVPIRGAFYTVSKVPGLSLSLCP
jgi:hypothetical protein